MFSNILFVDHAFSLLQAKFTTFLCVLYYLYINMFRYCCSINNTLLYVQGRVTRVETEIKMSLKLTSVVLYCHRVFQNDISYDINKIYRIENKILIWNDLIVFVFKWIVLVYGYCPPYSIHGKILFRLQGELTRCR